MSRLKIPNLWLLLPLVTHGLCITLLGVLESYPELSTLNGYLNSSNNGTSLLAKANDFTFLAPSNNAIKSLVGSNPSALTPDLLDATLQYSLLNGGYPSLSFTNNSQFVASNLNNASYANVTGGQRVELIRGTNGEPQILSGNKSVSTSPSTEIVCTGGIIHVIDEVLTIPLSTVLEITAANLEYFVSILNVGGYLNAANADYVNGIIEVPDVTYFIPNSAAALANATTLIHNSSSEDLQALFQYHVVPGFVGYSPLLTNGTSLKTAQGENVTITLQEGDIFVNAAKVISTDWIVANGVVHVIDDLLNRFDKSAPPPPPPPPESTSSSSTSSTPAPTSTPSPTTSPTAGTSVLPALSTKSHGLSTGAKVGIGVGVSVFGLAVLAGLAFFFFRSRKERPDSSVWDNSSMSGVPNPTGKYYVKRGTLQRQEDLGLGLQSTGMHDDHIAGGGEDSVPKTASPGPEIPARSPSRVLRGGGNNYF